MAIRNVGDAREVEDALLAILDASSEEEQAWDIQRMSIETLDIDVVSDASLVPLGGARYDALPVDARRLASPDEVSVVYIPVDAPRVGAMLAWAAAKDLRDVMEGEFLMLFTDRACDQLHIIHPDLSGMRPRLRRLVVSKGEKRRTVVQQIANMWDA